jgi:hypothetical protein
MGNRTVFRTRSQLEVLCKDDSGPVNLSDNFIDLRRACSDYPYQVFEAFLGRWQPDFITGARHWPWLAFAVSQYKFRRMENTRLRHKSFSGKNVEPTPTEIREKLRQISRNSGALRDDLASFQELSFRSFDETSPHRRPHLDYLDAMIKQAIAGNVAVSLDKSDAALASNFFDALEFLKILVNLEAMTAHLAELRVDLGLLSRPPGQPADPGLWHCVSIVRKVWESLTGRRASANKVHRSAHSGPEGSEPDFVRFVAGVVEIAGGPRPSRNQVQAALRSAPARSPKKK